MGGLRFIDAKPFLASVTDNGIDPDDVRVMIRTNEAISTILAGDTIPVNGMMTIDIQAINDVLFLPQELSNVIDIQVLGDATVRGNKDNTQGFYDIVNQFTYVDPAMAHDNPLIDYGLVPDQADPSILRRQYVYPGIQPNALVRITGAKSYIPITKDSDYLIIQNIEAIKCYILSIERYENNDVDGAAKFRELGVKMIKDEVTGFIMDPRNIMRRKAAYEDDLVAYPPGSYGWMRARMALEVPGAMNFGKSEVSRIMDQAEMRLMEGRFFRGCIKEYHADVVNGIVYFPIDVDSIVGANFRCRPIDIRSVLFKYLENGPGSSSCYETLEDLGEEYFSTSRNTRRKFRLTGASDTESFRLSVAAKLRWIQKQPADQMTVKHYEALRLMSTAIVLERQEKWQEAMANLQQAIAELDKDLANYLKGIKHTLPVETFGFGMGDVGGML